MTSRASRSAAARSEAMILLRFACGLPSRQSICAHAMFVFVIKKLQEISARGRGYNFVRRVFHSVSDDKPETGFANDALAFFDIRAFQANHNRHLNSKIRGGADDPARDHVATHDAAKNIDE